MMPRSPDLAIFVLTNKQTDRRTKLIALSLAHVHGVITIVSCLDHSKSNWILITYLYVIVMITLTHALKHLNHTVQDQFGLSNAHQRTCRSAVTI